MRMTNQQKAEYKLYRAECKLSGVEPSRKDFLGGEIPSCVRYQLQFGVWSRDIDGEVLWLHTIESHYPSPTTFGC